MANGTTRTISQRSRLEVYSYQPFSLDTSFKHLSIYNLIIVFF